MPPWLRRTVGVLTLGGGFLGLTTILIELYSGGHGVLELSIALLFLVLYVAGVAIGVLVLEKRRWGAIFAVPYFLIQVPIIYSPIISYQFSSGAHGYIYFGGGMIRFNWMMGSFWEIAIRSDNELNLGVNIVAILLVIVLWRYRRVAL